MKTDEIKKILNSFYEGKTSPEEELLLKNYFNGNDIGAELSDEKDMFLSFFDHMPVDIPASLEIRIENLIDQLDRKEKRTRLTIKNMVKWTSIAACVTLLISAGIYVNKISIAKEDQPVAKSVNYISADEVIKVENALRLLSSNFNKGLDQIDEVKDNFEKTSDILNETFK